MWRHEKIIAVAGLLLSSLGYPVGTFAVEFANPVSYPVGSSPTGIVVADFNGDGKPDIAVANFVSGNVSILRGNGDGTFQAAVNFDAGMANNGAPLSVAVGEFNGDGKLDLVVFQPGNSNPANILPGAVSVLLGNGDGTFQNAHSLALKSDDAATVVADFNLDGKLDLAVMNSSLGIVLFLGNGDGTFQPPRQTSVPSGVLLIKGDFNGDGKSDLAVASTNAVNLFLGNGDGTFQSGPTAAIGGGFVVQQVQAVDLNADGKVDLVVESEKRSQICMSGVCNTYPSSEHVSLFLVNADASLQPERVIASATSIMHTVLNSTGSQIHAPAVGDFNGDGKPDLAYSRIIFSKSSNPSNYIEIQLGHGDGTFSSPLRFADSMPFAPFAAAEDLNKDKLSDLIFLDTVNNAVVIELNTSPTSGADLGITDAGASAEPVGVGVALTYTANVLNEGPKDATGVTFVDTLPNGVSFVSAATTQGSCIQSNGIVTCNIGALASAFDAAVTITVTPTALGTITNQMRVSATEQDLVSMNNTATQATTVAPVFTLSVSKAGTGTGTVTSNVGGIDCGSSCSLASVSGTVVSLTATPTGSSTFGGWSGSCTSADPTSCTVTLNSDQSVTATFTIPPDFSVSPSLGSLTIRRGGQASETLTFPAQGGFSGTIALTCSVAGTAPMPTCGISSTSVKPGDTATLTIDARALSSELGLPSGTERGQGLWAVWLPLGMFGCLLATGLDKKRRRLWALCLLLIVATILPAACGGGSNSTQGWQPHNYTVTVTGTASAIQRSTSINVTVN